LTTEAVYEVSKNHF